MAWAPEARRKADAIRTRALQLEVAMVDTLSDDETVAGWAADFRGLVDEALGMAVSYADEIDYLSGANE